MPSDRDGGLAAAAFGVERFTVAAVLDRRAEQFGDRVLMSIAGTPVTFAEMRDRSCAAANVLAALGVNRGETVALFTTTCPEWVYFWLGAARIGAVPAAVNAASKGDFLLHALRLSQTAVVVTDAQRNARLAEVADRVDTLRSVLVQGDALADALNSASTIAPPGAPAEPHDIALFFTLVLVTALTAWGTLRLTRSPLGPTALEIAREMLLDVREGR